MNERFIMDTHLFGKNLANGSEGEALFIAEAGINHDGDYRKALKLVDVAVEAKADVVKFASFISEELLTKNSISSSYIKNASKKGEDFLALAKRHEIEFKHQEIIFKYCAKKGIKFLSTPFDEKSLDFLVDLGVEAIKVASGDLTNLPFLKKIAATRLPVIISSGMASYGEIEEACHFLVKEKVKKLFLMHCVSWYPSEIKDMNIRVVDTLHGMFGIPVGLSDHSQGINVALAARARGTKFFEKHITLSKKDFGPDHHASLEPNELKNLISSLREVELCLGDGHKKVIPIEYEQRKVHRRSVVAARPITPGTVITPAMLKLKRPGTGILPKYLQDVVGNVAGTRIETDQVIHWDMVQVRKN